MSVREIDALVRTGDAIRGGIERVDVALVELDRMHLRALADRLDVGRAGTSRELRAAVRRRLLGLKRSPR